MRCLDSTTFWYTTWNWLKNTFAKNAYIKTCLFRSFFCLHLVDGFWLYMLLKFNFYCYKTFLPISQVFYSLNCGLLVFQLVVLFVQMSRNRTTCISFAKYKHMRVETWSSHCHFGVLSQNVYRIQGLPVAPGASVLVSLPFRCKLDAVLKFLFS